jgi:hypothetical protein
VVEALCNVVKLPRLLLTPRNGDILARDVHVVVVDDLLPAAGVGAAASFKRTLHPRGLGVVFVAIRDVYTLHALAAAAAGAQIVSC